ncbi:rRNA-processing protein las1 [Neurospora sp. IMI 360204]|nr:rRNA-processing protein las1 [Neurospora sp. IMI 360204]
MVQYIFTPWRDRRELLAVRRQFYPHQYESQAASQRGGAGAKRQAQNKQRTTTTTTTTTTAARIRTRTDNGNGNEAGNINVKTESDDDNDRQDRGDQRRLAVARVSMWMQRGNCPHMVESTALLMAAILSDEEQTGTGTGTSGTSGTSSGMGMGMMATRGIMDGLSGSGIGVMSSSYAVRAAYSAAFSRPARLQPR